MAEGRNPGRFGVTTAEGNVQTVRQGVHMHDLSQLFKKWLQTKVLMGPQVVK